MIEKIEDIQQIPGLNNRVYDVLKEAIFKRILDPGKRINVNLLAQQWRVSRTPINEAIQRLMMEGLIEVIPRKGTFVSAINYTDVLEQLDLRLMFELKASDLLKATLSENQLEELKVLIIESHKCFREEDMDYISYTNLDIKFHETFIKWTGNGQLLKIYKAQNFHWHIARLYYNCALLKSTKGQQEHWDIYYAYKTGNLADVKENITKHIENAALGIKNLAIRESFT